MHLGLVLPVPFLASWVQRVPCKGEPAPGGLRAPGRWRSAAIFLVLVFCRARLPKGTFWVPKTRVGK